MNDTSKKPPFDNSKRLPPPPPKSLNQKATLPVEEKWLVDLLNEKCQAKGVLKGYKCQLIGEDKGFLSFVTRVTFDWDQLKSKGLDQLPKGVVIKKPTMDKLPPIEEGLGLRFEQLMDFHNRECHAYVYLNKHSSPPIPMARMFYAKHILKDIGEGIIILEDLTEMARSIRFDEVTTIDQVMAMAGHVARLQAYGLKNPDYVDFVKPVEKSPFEEMFKDLERGLDLTRDLYPGKFPYSNEEFRKMFEERRYKYPMFGVPTKDFPFTQVLSLGDVQPNNTLWKRGGPQKKHTTAEVAAFLDFQIFHLGNCMNDLSNSITFGLPVEVRRKHSDSIIDHYLACFEEALKDGDHSVPITKEEAKRVQLELMFQYGTMGLCMFPMFDIVMSSMTNELKAEYFDRYVASIQDGLQGLKALGC